MLSYFAEPLYVAYLAILALLTLFGVHRVVLLYLYFRHRGDLPRPKDRFQELPQITVQLPVFNEATVVERLLSAIARLDYPRDRLEIQVLDDSTDETRELARRKVAELRQQGLDICTLHRPHRQGFKAGALADGLKRAKGEFIAIFDADFLPNPGFLKEVIDHFTDSSVGMVQMRWGHLNREHSLLTRLQAMLLDGHFVIEHTARHRSGRYFNFNGTGGLWRRAALVDAGGWQHDTLTEDLDVSYRAQMRGWKFVYLRDPDVPGELPVEMNAFKSQQRRWAKGSIQTARKILPDLWKTNAPLRIKIEATLHLTANLAYPLFLLFCLLLLPALKLRIEGLGPVQSRIFDFSAIVLASVSVLSYYVAAQREIDRRWMRSLKYLPALLALGSGIAINNACAVIEALFRRPSPFQRTPKYDVIDRESTSPSRRYAGEANWLPALEIAFGLYLGIVVWLAASHSMWCLTGFATLFFAGFLFVGVSSVLESRVATFRQPIPRDVPPSVAQRIQSDSIQLPP